MKKNTSILILVSFGIIYSVLSIGDFSIRLSNIHSDNGPTTYSDLYANPEVYEKDLISEYGPAWTKSSVTFWLPALLHKHLGFSAEKMSFLLMFFQIFLLILSVHKLAISLKFSSWVSWLTIGVVFSSIPWDWNLANYKLDLTMPMYTTLVVAIINFSFSEFLNGKVKMAWFLLLISSLVHPIYTLYGVSCLFVFAILLNTEILKKKPSLTINYYLLFLTVVIVCILPPLLNSIPSEKLISPSAQWDAVAKHIHGVPWLNYKVVWNKTMPFVFSLVGLLFLIFKKSIFSKLQRYFLFSVLLTSVFLGLFHVIGYGLENKMITLFSGLRFTMILSFCIVLYICRWVESEFENRNFYLIFISYFLIVSLMIGTITALYLIFFLLFGYFLLNKSLSLKRLIGSLLFIIIPIFILDTKNLSNFLKEFIFYSKYPFPILLVYVFGILLVVELFNFYKSGRSQKKSVTLQVVAIATALLYSFNFGNMTKVGSKQNLYDAQKWAKENTNKNDLFVSVFPWRTVSKRPVINPKPDFTLEIYTPTHRIRKYNNYFLSMYGLEREWKNLSRFDLNSIVTKQFKNISEANVVKILNDWGADYFVWPKEFRALDLDPVYSNSNIIIYRKMNK